MVVVVIFSCTIHYDSCIVVVLSIMTVVWLLLYFVLFAGNHHDIACKYFPGNSPHVINVGATQKEKDKLY